MGYEIIRNPFFLDDDNLSQHLSQPIRVRFAYEDYGEFFVSHHALRRLNVDV